MEPHEMPILTISPLAEISENDDDSSDNSSLRTETAGPTNRPNKGSINDDDVFLKPPNMKNDTGRKARHIFSPYGSHNNNNDNSPKEFLESPHFESAQMSIIT